MLMYAQDWNDILVVASAVGNPWYRAWDRYGTNGVNSLIVCPAWKPYTYTNQDYTYGLRDATEFWAYKSNAAYFPNWSQGSGYPMYVYLSYIRKPSLLWLIADSFLYYPQVPSVHGNQYRTLTQNSNQSGSSGKVHFRHPGATANFLFVDGHVEAMTKDRFFEVTVSSGEGFASNSEFWVIDEKNQRYKFLMPVNQSY